MMACILNRDSRVRSPASKRDEENKLITRQYETWVSKSMPALEGGLLQRHVPLYSEPREL